MDQQYVLKIDPNEMRWKIQNELIEKKKLLEVINDDFDINVETIMKEIRSQIETETVYTDLQNNTVENNTVKENYSNSSNKETKLYNFLRRVKGKIKKYSFYKAIKPFDEKLYSIFPDKLKYTNEISINDLISHDDKDFIISVYQILLSRKPDPVGLNEYLNALRNMKLSKIDIIKNISISVEGKQKKVKVKNLNKLYYSHKLKRFLVKIPLLGYFINLLINLLMLPKKIKYFNQSFADLNQRYFSLSDKEENIVNRIDQCEKQYAESSNNLQNNLSIIKNQVDSERIRINKLLDSENEIKENQLEILRNAQNMAFSIQNTQNNYTELIKKLHALNILKAEHLLDELYVSFENQFRGSREEIKKRMAVYIPFINSFGNKEITVLDIGCGRGEWLDVLGENGYHAEGIDINQKMINECDKLNLQVYNSDAITFLKTAKDNSYEVITAIQVIEHLDFNLLISMIDECYRVLKPGGIIIFETPNPENIIVGACNFYFDPTHRNPLPPKCTEYLVQARGFSKVEILRLHPYNFVNNQEENTCLQYLSDLFNKEQDYAVIAYKI